MDINSTNKKPTTGTTLGVFDDYTFPDKKIQQFNNAVMFIMIVVGLVGNTITISILLQRANRKSSTAVFYMCLAVSDNCIIITNLLLNWIYFAFEIDIFTLSKMCNVILFVQITAIQTSSWIVVAITIERLVSVKLPFKAKELCKPRNSIGVTIGTVALLALSNIFRIIGRDEQCTYISATIKEYCEKYDIYIYTTVTMILPSIIIIGGNIVICRGIRRPYGVQQSSREGDLCVTRTLVFVSATFVGTTLPGFTYSILLHIRLVPKIDELLLALLLLSNMNVALNFFLYMLQGSRFRQQVKRLFICQRHPRRQTDSVFVVS